MKLLALLALAVALPASADQYVQGHYRSDGTYVAPHYRSDANGSVSDNWSTQGNRNPYTHQSGTQADPRTQLPPSPYGNYRSPHSPYQSR